MIRTAFRAPGRIVPPQARALRGRCVVLAPGAVMPWHSTGKREELLILLRGRIEVQTRAAAGRVARRPLVAGDCAFVRLGTWHQVVNAARRPAQYLYVTASAG